MAANAEEGSPGGEQEGEEPSVFKLWVNGANLHELMSQTDTFEEDIQRGYKTDPFFRNVIEKMGTHPSFKMKNKIIYMKNRGSKDIVCIPSTMLAETTLRTRILDQAHQVVGHYRPQRMSDSRSKELGGKESNDQVRDQLKHRKCNGTCTVQNKLQVYACNDEGDENNRKNTTRCKNICLKCSKEHDISTWHTNNR